jgi:hypothetical protein
MLALSCQIAFWSMTNHLKPEMCIVPNVPGVLAVKANALGDEQLYFRILALEIQNAGDLFGRFTALKNYDYKKLSAWFRLLDSLDDLSHFVPSIASYYYSQTQRQSDVRYIVDYLDEHSSKNLPRNWWWQAQAVSLAQHKLHDQKLALKLAKVLASNTGPMPIWAKQMPAFIYEKLGEKEASYLIIKNLLENAGDLSKEEQNFMHYYINERLDKIIENKK